LFASDGQGVEQVSGPAACLFVEEECAGGVAGVGGHFAGQPQPQVVFGQQHLVDLTPEGGFVLLEPAQGSCLEAGSCGAAADGEQPGGADRLGDLLDLCAAAAVGPDHGGGQQASLRVEEDGAVHLARQPDGQHLAVWVVGEQGADCGHRCLPPGFGVLFGAVGCGLFDRVLFCGAGQRGSAGGGQQHLDC
jgi:hypothetical protein